MIYLKQPTWAESLGQVVEYLETPRVQTPILPINKYK
jgi:hypothetical protein